MKAARRYAPLVHQCRYVNTTSSTKATAAALTINDVTVEEESRDSGYKTFEDIPEPGGVYTKFKYGFRLFYKPFGKYSLSNRSELMTDLKNKYGPLVKTKLGGHWFVHAFNPEDIEKVFRMESKYPERFNLPLFEVYQKRNKMERSLVSLNGEEWLQQRRPVSKVLLRPHSVAKYIHIIEEIADDFVDKFRNRGRIDNLPCTLMEYTSEGVGMLCFNKRLGNITSTDDMTPVMFHTKTFLECISTHMWHFVPWYMFFRSPFYRKFEKSFNYLYHMAQGYMSEAIKEMQNTKEEELPQTLLVDFLNTKDLAPEKGMRALVDVFIGGIDSTANSATFLLYYLAKHPDKQEKLLEELKQIDDTKPLNGESLGNLPYLKACLKESFRLVFPIDGGTIRKLEKDAVLSGYLVPAGVPIQLCSSVISMDEQYFQEPNKFMPERWLRGEGTVEVNPFAHIPFGHGPRKCVGQRFAELEIYILIIKFVKAFKLSVPDDGKDHLPFIYKTFATPKDPVTIFLEKR